VKLRSQRDDKDGQDQKRWGPVLGLTFALALALAILIVWLYRPAEPFALRRESEAGEIVFELPSGLAEGLSARQAYESAEAAALAWQPDARPATVSAHWRPRQGGWSSKVIWTFQFYSPSNRRLVVIVVDKGLTQLLQESLSPYALPTFDVESWRVDSQEAVQTWWNHGGGAFHTTHSDVDLVARLQAAEAGDGRPVWRVTGVAGGQVKQVDVDGVTGERLDVDASNDDE
jgi:hypothetical protein